MPFTEVADRVWVTATRAGDPTTTVVAGARGLLVVDPAGVDAEALGGLDLGDADGAGAARDVVAVVLTHAHGEHVGDLDALRAAWPEVVVHLHETAADTLGSAGPAAPALRTFSAAAVVDLGDRVVEVVHPGAGHSDGDAVVRLPDVDVVVVGDLVAAGQPDLGPGCRPLAWPSTLDVVLDLLTPASAVVCGHGGAAGVVDREHVEDQRNRLGLVSQTVRDLAGSGVRAEEALTRGEWPYPAASLAHAVANGYAALPRGARQLPRA